VAEAARSAAAALGTMGVALSPSTVPAAGKPGFSLGDEEVEWGLGIHGEAGVRRSRIEPADATVEHLLSAVVDDLGLQPGSRVALLANNLGGTAAGELSIVAGSAVRFLRERGLVVERAWSGTFLTALEMAGCSLSVLEVDDQRLARLDAPARTSAWPEHLGPVSPAVTRLRPAAVPPAAQRASLSPSSTLRLVIEAVCARLLEAESALTELDSQVGDGDLGDSLSRAARSVLAELDSYPADTDPAEVLRRLSATVRRVVGGTSGPLYAVMLVRAAVALQEAGSPSPAAWSSAFSAAVAGVQDLGGAAPGDRTMVDALQPAAQALAAGLARSDSTADAMAASVAAAEAGAAETASWTARLGRSSYVGDRALGVPDPGAQAVAWWLAAVRDAVSGRRA